MYTVQCTGSCTPALTLPLAKSITGCRETALLTFDELYNLVIFCISLSSQDGKRCIRYHYHLDIFVYLQRSCINRLASL